MNKPTIEQPIASGGDPVAAPPAGDGRIAIVVRLTQRHYDYLTERAAQHGETPERHIETILRNFRAYFDDRRPELAAPPAQRNAGPVVGRVA